MSFFHIHQWKEIARTYAPSVVEMGIIEAKRLSQEEIQGCTTILWECQDPSCQELRQEKMLGRIIAPTGEDTK